MSKKYYSVLVTRDSTESALIPVEAECQSKAAEHALSRETEATFAHLFTPNDGGLGESNYLGDENDDIEEITETEYLALTNEKSSTRQKGYEQLYAYISDMVEAGRLREIDIPDDYEAILAALDMCSNIDSSVCHH